MNNTTQVQQGNRVTALDKASEQRKVELFEAINTASGFDIPLDVMDFSNMLDNKEVSIGGTKIGVIPESIPKAYKSQKGKRIGELNYSLFSNNYSPFLIKRGNRVARVYLSILIQDEEIITDKK